MTKFMGEDPYEVLGLSPDATDKEIKKAYRTLALQHHPDRALDSNSDHTTKQRVNTKFATISQAYEILMNDHLKRDYYENKNNNSNSNYSGNNSNKPSSTTSKKSASTNKKSSPYFDYQFSDPYEIWKRDFQDQFGYEYPGAKYDFVDYDTPTITPDHATAAKDKALLLQKHGITDDGTFQPKTDFGVIAGKNKGAKNGKKKKKSAFSGIGFNPFRRASNDDDDDSDDEDPGNQLVIHDGNPNQVDQKNNSCSSNSQLAMRNNENQLDTYQGNNNSKNNEPSTALVMSQGRNNRPTSMDVQTKKDDATGVTTTITTITRPDGTTETMVMRTGLPKKKNPDLPQLTNGTEPHMLLTNGEDNKNNNNHLRLTNGNNTTNNKYNTSNNDKNNGYHEKPMLQLSNGTTTSPSSSSNKHTTSSSNDKAIVVGNNTKPNTAAGKKKPFVNPMLKNNALVVSKKK